jgi:outer membrane protein with beta-barrel domain
MRALVIGLCLAIAAPAAAQSTSVGVSGAWDLARFSKVESNDNPLIQSLTDSLDGEAFGFTVNVRRAIGENWGVSVEYSHSGDIESTSSRRIGVAGSIPASPTGVSALPPNLIRPDFEIEVSTEQQHQSIGALAWVRHDVGDRVTLSYLGGVAFVRSELERDLGIDPRILAIAISPTELTTIEHNVAPLVGIDADFELTDHTAFTAGLRLQGVSVGGRDGWVIRPGVGVRWTF